MSTASQIVESLKRKGLTLSTAESCTGGLIGTMVTDIPGASEVYVGGVIAYSNGLKVNILGVPEVDLDDFGAVSEQVALHMAEGIKRITGSDIAISTTGNAGPASSGKAPVGVVYICLLASDSFSRVERLTFDGSRSEIRVSSSMAALKMIEEYLKGNPSYND